MQNSCGASGHSNLATILQVFSLGTWQFIPNILALSEIVTVSIAGQAREESVF